MIQDKATELGRLIGQASEYQAMRRAERALRDDTDTQKKLELIQTLAKQVDVIVGKGEMPTPELAEQYETAVRELEISPTGQAYVVARANFEKLMTTVNEAIGAGMEKGATSNIISLS